MLFDIKTVDREFYRTRLQDFLPERIIDVHTHCWRASLVGQSTPDERTVTWPARVAAENPFEHLRETYRLMFPGKTVTPLVFPQLPATLDDVDGLNDYVADVSAKHNLPALLWSLPQWAPDELERRIRDGGFLGVKSYLTMAPRHLASDEITIFDFFPRGQLEVLDGNRWILMLHLPRANRLRDKANLAGLLEISRDFPDIPVIVAHVGRAYCPEDVGDAFEVLAAADGLYFDISANTNGLVFERLIEAVGPGRILFGSDLPITRMRMRRVCRDGVYVNIVPAGIYGDVSGDVHMEEVRGEAAEGLTFFMYEEIEAFRQAALRRNLSSSDVTRIFHDNAAELISSAAPAGVCWGFL